MKRPRLEHFKHPLRSAHSLLNILLISINRYKLNSQFKNIPRIIRSKCWCGGNLAEYDMHKSYGVCIECGTYVNKCPPDPSKLTDIYGLDKYWHDRQRFGGHPSIDKRGELYRVDGRLDKWVEMVLKYGPDKGVVIEVGCAPGVMLIELELKGYDCVGVEANMDVVHWLRQNLQLNVHQGIFPEISLPKANLFLSFDVLEHSMEPLSFMNAISEHLEPGGVAILQTAIDRYAVKPPFGEQFEKIFDDVEHTYIYTDKAIHRLIGNTDLRIISLDHRTSLAGELIVIGKP